MNVEFISLSQLVGMKFPLLDGTEAVIYMHFDAPTPFFLIKRVEGSKLTQLTIHELLDMLVKTNSI